MHLSLLTIENFRMFGSGANALVLPFCAGLTAFVGENDAGKSAIIDALRFVLGTTDQEWYRLEDTDFFNEDSTREIRIACKFENLSSRDARAFLEFLSYSDEAIPQPLLYVHWTARSSNQTKNGRSYRTVEIRCGANGDGPTMPAEVRDFLRTTYLRPLRDAEQALSAGRGSRLSQVLQNTDDLLRSGTGFRDEIASIDPTSLNVLGIGDLANALLEAQKGIVDARDHINSNLRSLALKRDSISSRINVSDAAASDTLRLRRLLEKFDLTLEIMGRAGLGSNNLLFIACELLLLSQEQEGSRILLLEEPEAHLHPQRQLQVMKFIQEYAVKEGVQVLVTTHSPNLASAINLNNLVMLRDNKAFPMSISHTKLESADYRFLQRFLDATKANLFFASAVIIVEGDAENILIPTIAKLIGRDLTQHGVSIVNVGGIGLRRYARIFQRADRAQEDGSSSQMRIPVACITDLDVIPVSAAAFMGESRETKEALGPEKVKERKHALIGKATGQCVQTFVADQWTFEYDLAYYGLAEQVFVSAKLAKRDKSGTPIDLERLRAEAIDEFEKLKTGTNSRRADTDNTDTDSNEELATHVYREFFTGTRPSKAVAAQYLADLLQEESDRGTTTPEELRPSLPPYILAALDFVVPSVAVDEGAPSTGVSE